MTPTTASTATQQRASAPTLEQARRAADVLVGCDGVGEVLLYGSVARGDQHEGSDIDLVVIDDDLDYPEWQTRADEVAESFERLVCAWQLLVAARRSIQAVCGRLLPDYDERDALALGDLVDAEEIRMIRCQYVCGDSAMVIEHALKALIAAIPRRLGEHGFVGKAYAANVTWE